MPDTKESSSPVELEKERWEEETLDPALSKHPERKKSFQTVSLAEVDRLYTPADTEDVDFSRDIAFPGEFPYTRGIHQPVIAANSGRCASLQASVHRKKQTPASST